MNKEELMAKLEARMNTGWSEEERAAVVGFVMNSAGESVQQEIVMLLTAIRLGTGFKLEEILNGCFAGLLDACAMGKLPKETLLAWIGRLYDEEIKKLAELHAKHGEEVTKRVVDMVGDLEAKGIIVPVGTQETLSKERELKIISMRDGWDKTIN